MRRFLPRYTRWIHATSATACTSRQTDFETQPLQRIALFCHALCDLSVTAQQRFSVSTLQAVTQFQRAGADHAETSRIPWPSQSVPVEVATGPPAASSSLR